MKNNKKIFLTLTLVILLLGVTAVAAADNNTAGSTDTVSDAPAIAADNPVVTDEVQTYSADVVETDTKNIVKEERNI